MSVTRLQIISLRKSPEGFVCEYSKFRFAREWFETRLGLGGPLATSAQEAPGGFEFEEPVKKLQDAASLRIFGIAKARGRRQYAQRCRRCFASPCGLPSAGCLPSRDCPARATRAKPKRHATLRARGGKAGWRRCPLGYSPLRGCALASASPYGVSCPRVAFSNFSTDSKWQDPHQTCRTTTAAPLF
jgi:hypothetical protein